MDNPRTIQGWRAAYGAVDRLLRGNYADLIGEDAVVMWLALSDGEDYAEASWERPAERDGWRVSGVSCRDALDLRNRVSLMVRYPLLRRG